MFVLLLWLFLEYVYDYVVTLLFYGTLFTLIFCLCLGGYMLNTSVLQLRSMLIGSPEPRMSSGKSLNHVDANNNEISGKS